MGMHDRTFFRAFLRNWKEVGSPFQTSRQSARKICDAIDFDNARRIVEIGSGAGSVTKEILRFLHPDAELIVFEINPELCRCLEAIEDPRLVVYNESGFRMSDFLNGKVDYVISEIPIATLSKRSLENYYQGIRAILSDRGSCIQVQLSLISYPRLKRFFKTVNVAFTLFNAPPMFIYCCRD
jgi:phospholipid N-methyltransferase